MRKYVSQDAWAKKYMDSEEAGLVIKEAALAGIRVFGYEGPLRGRYNFWDIADKTVVAAYWVDLERGRWTRMGLEYR
jgi:hypothetical protein